ncbi:MAG: hypothetical protein HY508_06390 [Acidobacteria bacterium]|nr:hypothetical protein [Acidobacteriota bacterium]
MVTVTNVRTGVEFKAETGGDGQFVGPNLLPDERSLPVLNPGILRGVFPGAFQTRYTVLCE